MSGNWRTFVCGDSLPGGRLPCGNDIDGQKVYVGRAYHGGDLLPAKVIPDKNRAYVSFGGKEIPKTECEILCAPNNHRYVWKHGKNGNVPSDAVVIGITRCTTSQGEKLYFGLADHRGIKVPGKVHGSHGCMYMPFGGEEIRKYDYKVLCLH